MVDWKSVDISKLSDAIVKSRDTIEPIYNLIKDHIIQKLY